MGNTQGSHVEKMGGVPVSAGVMDGGSMSPSHRQEGNVFDFSASVKKKPVSGQDSIEEDRLVMTAAGAGTATAPTSAAGSPIPGTCLIICIELEITSGRTQMRSNE